MSLNINMNFPYMYNTGFAVSTQCVRNGWATKLLILESNYLPMDWTYIHTSVEQLKIMHTN